MTEAMPELAALRASTRRQEQVERWLRLLAPLVLLVVAGAALTTDPRPGTDGERLAVSLALAAFVLAAVGVTATMRRPVSTAGPNRVALVAVVALLVTSGALIAVQPDGAAVAGLFVGIARLVPLLRGRVGLPVALAGLVVIAVVAAWAAGGPMAQTLLTALMLAAFYGVMVLSARLAEANRLAEGLVVALQASRGREAAAAGLAERQRIAREMHDVLAHSLSGLLLQLEAARLLAAGDPADPRLPDALERAHRLARGGLEEAREAIGMLRDDDLPGPERLAALAEDFQSDRGVPCRVTVAGPARPLPSPAGLALYRVAQEALTNVARHAAAERVELRLEYTPSTARLVVEDFGAAAVLAAVPTADGHGLTGMRERAELLDGTLLTEVTGSGFRVELEVPA